MPVRRSSSSRIWMMRLFKASSRAVARRKQSRGYDGLGPSGREFSGFLPAEQFSAARRNDPVSQRPTRIDIRFLPAVIDTWDGSGGCLLWLSRPPGGEIYAGDSALTTRKHGGEGGIRTHGGLAPSPDFESGTFNRTPPPLREISPPSRTAIRRNYATLARPVAKLPHR